jgi:hypothetical protein
VNWEDADDNADGHLDDPRDDPRNPPDDEPDYRQEGEHMDWDIKSTRLERSGMWQAVAVEAGTGYRQVSGLWATREHAEADARVLVDRFERQIGVRS